MNERQIQRLAKLIMKMDLDCTGNMYAGNPWDFMKEQCLEDARRWAEVIVGDYSSYEQDEWFHSVLENND